MRFHSPWLTDDNFPSPADDDSSFFVLDSGPPAVFAADPQVTAPSSDSNDAGATLPNGAESEVVFVSGVTSTAKLAATSFASWNGGTPAAYGSTDSVKWGNTTLSTNGTPGGTVTYWFDSASNWSSTEKNALAAGLALWSAEANITFVLASSASSANQTFYRGAANSDSAYETFTRASFSSVGSGSDGHAISARIVIDTSEPFWHVGTSFDDAGGYGWQTIVHEEGHLLGLGHGGPYNGDVNVATQQFSPYDMRLWTLMSYIDPNETSAKYYNSYPVTGTNWGYNSAGYMYEPTTPMIIDILAAQRIYGAQTSGPLSSGGQVFGFHSNIADPVRQFFDFTVNQHPVVTLWDGGINNTLDLSGWSSNSTVNLNPGTFSSGNGQVNNIAIAEDTRIDNVITGSGNDTIVGSAFDNTLRGNAGNDTIDGGAGIDTAVFSGPRSAFTLTALAGTGVRVSGPDGSDTLTNVERLAFSDQTVTWPTQPVSDGPDNPHDLGTHGATWPIAGVGDFDGHGTSDVLWRSPSTGQVDEWILDNGQWSRSQDLGAAKPANWTLAGTGDFDGDGTSDVLWRDISNSQVDQWHMKNGNWAGSIDLGKSKGADWALVGVGDFNGDGTSDVLWRKVDTSQVDQWQMQNGNWSKSIDLGATKGSAWTLAGVGDFNGDGTTDVLWRNIKTSQVDQWQMKNGNWSQSIDLGASKGADWVVAGVGDFNGDHTSDILWFNKATGQEEYWAMKNGNFSSSVDLGILSTSWQPAGIGDFNHDGKSDALWLDPASGHVYEQLWII